MALTESTRKKIIGFYCFIFYVLMLFKWANGMWLYQLNPFFFFTRLDLTTWLVMLTNWHQLLVNNQSLLLATDIIFYSLPLVYWITFTRFNKVAPFIAAIMLLVNFVYVAIYCSYPSNSPEGHIAWLLFPLLFIASSLQTFWYILKGLRYFFIYFFFSAGVWKLAQHGFFYTETMSGILQMQHKSLLIGNKESIRADIYNWLITHPIIASIFYRAATLAELFFGIGFFTKKFDHLLIILFIGFLVFNLLIMRINYFEVIPFLIPLYYSKEKLLSPENLKTQPD